MTCRKLLMVAGCVIAAGFFSACSDDSTSPPPSAGVEFKDLQAKDDVLFNLALAYNRRSTVQLDKLLDEDFIFLFSSQDVIQNGTPASWPRTLELDAAGNIFDPTLPDDARVVSIDVRLYYSAGGWLEEPPGGSHPGESWWTKTATYDCVVQRADGFEYRAVSRLALFKIRRDAGAGHWRLVSWYDDVGAAAHSPESPAVDDVSWGLIKYQYVP